MQCGFHCLPMPSKSALWRRSRNCCRISTDMRRRGAAWRTSISASRRTCKNPSSSLPSRASSSPSAPKRAPAKPSTDKSRPKNSPSSAPANSKKKNPFPKSPRRNPLRHPGELEMGAVKRNRSYSWWQTYAKRGKTVINADKTYLHTSY